MNDINEMTTLDNAREIFRLEAHRLPSELVDVFNQDRITKQDITDFVDTLSSLEGSLGEDPYPVNHHISEGFYRREVKLPTGHLLAGKIHKKESYVVMLTGRILVADDLGVRELVAPCTFTSTPGKQRIGYVIDECIWLDIHKVDAETIEDAEKEIFADTYIEADQCDYERMLIEMGVTEDEVRAQSESTGDMLPVQDGSQRLVSIRDSEIEGLGVFAAMNFPISCQIVKARIGNMRTEAGRFANHSCNPNAVAVLWGDGIYFVAINDIEAGDEITVDYRQVRKVALEADKQH